MTDYFLFSPVLLLLLFIALYSCIPIGQEPTDNYAYLGADKINLVSVKVKFGT